ncbi:MAG: M23 family metallopeptidase [Proteobacteria bacterium]|nr:M23 family metallopeptidase [Pseudomonadota bacterium]
MFHTLWFRAGLFTVVATGWFNIAQALELRGECIQGGLIFGLTQPGNQIFLDDTEVMVSGEGKFLIGFGRDETGERLLRVKGGPGFDELVTLRVAPREYNIEKVDGLPPRTVTPDPAAAKRIAEEAAMVSSARSRRDARTDYAPGFAWPAQGRISGVYGSQRILNGEPRRPHFGLDIAAPTGSPVYAPAGGIVTLNHPDMYFSGGTLILDHGQGLSSTFLHLSKILVEAGTTVQQGDLIAEIGSTGRASGPHLDWRMNWLNRRVDPQLLMKGTPQQILE